MAFDKATLQRHWRVTVVVCLAYTAILSLFLIVIFFHIAPGVPDASQAKVVHRPSVQSGPMQLAIGGK